MTKTNTAATVINPAEAQAPVQQPEAAEATTPVTGIIPEVAVDAIDWEEHRSHQSKPLKAGEVDALTADLQKEFPGLTFTPNKRYFYCLSVKRDGRTLCDLWAKRDFPRLVLKAKVLSGVTFSIDLTTRTAIKDTEMCTDEVVVTYDEARQMIHAMVDSPKPAEQPEEKPAETPAEQPAKTSEEKPVGKSKAAAKKPARKPARKA